MAIIYKIYRVLFVGLIFMMSGVLYGQKNVKAVDLGLSVKWANMNVGADSPEDYGDYFAWGEVAPKRYYGQYSEYKHYDIQGKEVRFHKYNFIGYGGLLVVDSLLNLEPVDDAATKQMGKGWRMPTQAEMAELLDTRKCIITKAVLNGTRGLWIKGRSEVSDSIFLPIAGYRDYGTYRFFPGTQGRYWTSTLILADSLNSIRRIMQIGDEDKMRKVKTTTQSAVCLMYSDVVFKVGMANRRSGCTIRAVRK